MAVTTTKTNKPLNPRGNDQSPKGYNRAELYTGKALDFDGVNDYVQVADSDDLDGFTNFTLHAIVKADTFPNYCRIFDKNHTSAYNLAVNTSNQLYMYAKNTAFNFDYVVPTGEYVSIVVAFTGGSKAALFINGQLEETITTSLASISSNGFDLYIGRLYSGAGNPWDGHISNAKIFNVALTAAQVADLYNNPEKIVPTGVADSALKLWLPMQEGAGTTAYDGSGNGNHGTISGGLWVHGVEAPVAQTAVISWNKGVNLLKYSENFDDAPNVLDASTYSENEYVSPSGSTNAPKFTETTANDRHGFYQYVTIAAGSISASIFTKQIDRRYVHFQSNATGSGENSYIDLEDGSVVSEGTGWSLSTEDYGNGWYRIKATCTAVAGNKYFIWGVSQNGTTNSYVGDTNYDFTFWGAQVKQSASAGLYVPTPVAPQTSDILLPQGLTTGRDITGVNLFENVRKQGALNLDGNSRVSVHENASIDLSDCSLEAWVCPLPESDSGWTTIFSKVSQANLQIYLNAADVLAHYNTATAGGVLYGTAFNKNEWHHIVCVEDGTDVLTYVDGVLRTTKTISLQMDSDGEFSIGSKPGVLADEITAQIAQPRIYNRALTAEEVERNYTAGKYIYTND